MKANLVDLDRVLDSATRSTTFTYSTRQEFFCACLCLAAIPVVTFLCTHRWSCCTWQLHPMGQFDSVQASGTTIWEELQFGPPPGAYLTIWQLLLSWNRDASTISSTFVVHVENICGVDSWSDTWSSITRSQPCFGWNGTEGIAWSRCKVGGSTPKRQFPIIPEYVNAGILQRVDFICTSGQFLAGLFGKGRQFTSRYQVTLPY